MNLDTSKPIKSVSYNGVDVPLAAAPELLWTNAAPTNSFAAQALTMPDGYDGYFIEMAGYATSGYYYIQFFSRSASQLFTVSQTDGVASTRSTRAVNISGTVIDFGNAYYNTSSTNNNYALPTRIWGVKFTL